jgi:predicted DNA-binding protein
MKKRQVAVYLNPEQKARLEEVAEARGMSASTFVRSVVLDELQKRGEPPSPEERRADA